MSWRRVLAINVRYLYLLKRNPARLFDIFFWPVMDLTVWGFVSLYLVQTSGDLPGIVAQFLGALILWDILLRSNFGVSVSYLEDVWTRNVLNLFVSPLTKGEYVLSLVLTSVVRVLMSATVLTIGALVLFHFNIFTLGLALVPLFINVIIFGNIVGIIAMSLVIRFGQSMEIFAWALAFFVVPFAAVYYPVSVLPSAVEAVARALPPAHIFEAMRTVLHTGQMPWGEFLIALGLNAVYFAAAISFFAFVFRNALKHGRLVKTWQ